MIRNPKLVQRFEESLIKAHGPDYQENLRMFEALFEEARALGIFPLKDPLEGIEVDIHLAKIINVRTTPRQDCHRSR